jgi:hypothetical protein
MIKSHINRVIPGDLALNANLNMSDLKGLRA